MSQVIGKCSDPETQALLGTCMDNFLNAWTTGDWTPFTSMISEDLIFQFPAGPLMGLYMPPVGHQMMMGFASSMAHNRMTEIVQGERFFAGDWLVAMFRSKGVINAQPYTGVEAIFLRAAGGKIVEYREYMGEMPVIV